MKWRKQNRSCGLSLAATYKLDRAPATLVRQRLLFESLEDRRMLASDWPDMRLISFDAVQNATSAYQSEPLDAGNYTASVTASDTNGGDSGSMDQGVASVGAPRDRPTLSATGTTFVADNGSLLRGPFASTEWGNPPPLNAIQSIKDFGANAIHLYGEVINPSYTGVPGPGDEPGYAASRIDQMVQMTRDEGLYLVLTIGNGGNNGSFNYDYVMDFWNFYAPRYKNETHVIFEIQNEPHAWSAPYTQATLDMEADAYTLIRSLAPDTPILLFSFAVLGSGPNAVADIAEVSAAASIDWTNAAVAFHGYAGHQSTTTSVEYILSAGYPVFMTEFGGSDWGTAEHGLDVEMTAQLERLNVSWLTFQHIPPNFIASAFTDPTAYYDLVNNAGLSWVPDFGTWPENRGVYGNGGQPRATTGLTGTQRIEAEYFDTGAQGVSHSDTDSVNQGGLFRPDDGVDLETAVDVGRGYHVASTSDGEWLEYTVFVTEPGYHDVSLRIASSTEGAIRAILNREDKTGEWLLPNTGGSQSWTTVTKQVFLEYGRQKLRLEIATGGFNLNWIELSPITSGSFPNGAYKILNRNSALAAEADAANSRVIQNIYTGATNERWNLVHRGAGQYSITSVANGWSWNTFYDSNEEPLTLAPWGYDGHPDRRFIIAPEDNGYFRILVVDGGLSIEIGGASLASGTPAQQYVYHDENHQQWAVLTPTAPSFPTGLSAAWGDPAQVPGDYNSDGAVNGRDFLVWQRSFGTTLGDADGDGNGIVDNGDLEVWSTGYGHEPGSSWVGLSWNAVAGATSYNVKRATVVGGPHETIAAGIAATNFSDTGLVAGNTYYYVVSAVSASGESLVSAEESPPLLHAHLQFDEASGTIAADATGNGWTGTLVNGPLRTMGISGNAVDLDGTNDHVRLPSGVVDGLTEVTFATWVNLDSLNNWARLFDFGSGTIINMFLAPRSGFTGSPVFAITTSGGGGEQRINSGVAIPIGTWTHVAITLNGSTGILYINGLEVGRNSSMTLTPFSLGVTTQNYIGKSQYSDPYLNGLVDDFRIYDYALSAAQVAALATSSFTAVTATFPSMGAEEPLQPLLESEPVAASGVNQAEYFSLHLAAVRGLTRSEHFVEWQVGWWEVGEYFSKNRATGGRSVDYLFHITSNSIADKESTFADKVVASEIRSDRIGPNSELVDEAMARLEYEIWARIHLSAN
jgi:hypothetical protein